MKQIPLFKNNYSASFGGSLGNGKRKSRRPLNVKNPLHIVLKTNLKKSAPSEESALSGSSGCSGSLALHHTFITKILTRFAHQFHITINEKAIVRDHIHLLIQIKSRECYHNFARAVAGVLARTLKLKWALRPFTRIVSWGRDFKRVQQYVFQNQLEADGLIDYQPRSQRKKKKPS